MSEAAVAGSSRRDFLSRSALVAAGLVLSGGAGALLSAPNAAAAASPGYGPLVGDPAGRLALPAGFRYSIVSEAGVTRLDSGEPSPTNSDGMGAFADPAGGTRLVQNHELKGSRATAGAPAVPPATGLTYDPGAPGGTTTVRVDATGRRLGEVVSLAGTASNCAGGITPWGTWLSCEETEDRAGTNGFARDHGYVFEVDPFDQAANASPSPIKALGRFAHEAVAVDPTRGALYLTEDAATPNGLLYSWTPPAGFVGGRGALRSLGPTAGVLEAMAATTSSGARVDDLSRATAVGTRLRVRWTTVPDRDARTRSVRSQIAASSVTRARKLEGCWWGDGGAYVVASYARSESPVPHDGQVWFYDPQTSTLTLRIRFGVSRSPNSPGDGPDNITVSPWGGLVIAEDGVGAKYLLGATPAGQTFPLAGNQRNTNEMAGPVYSPDKSILFANLYDPGTLYAITGPWRSA